LAVTLILSNFSFITTYSICSMGNMKESCACKNINNDVPSGLNIAKEKKSCCEQRIIELSNSNILSIDNSNSFDCIHGICYLLKDEVSLPENQSYSNILVSPDKVPKDGIPVNNSSLLI
jgi:hypothetical protein